MDYQRFGKSRLMLPRLSFGLWYNFGGTEDPDVARGMMKFFWGQGITHFDLANIYGSPKGEAERFFGKMLREDLAGLRDQMVLSTKAG